MSNQIRVQPIKKSDVSWCLRRADRQNRGECSRRGKDEGVVELDMRLKWKGIIRQSSKRAQFVKILDTNEKRVIEADCFESHESRETQEDERRMGNGNVCDAQTEAVVLLLIIHSVRTLQPTKETDFWKWNRFKAPWFSLPPSLKRSLETTANTALTNPRGTAVWLWNINTCWNLKGLFLIDINEYNCKNKTHIVSPLYCPFFGHRKTTQI